MPYKAIIHVAGINLLWRASETSIRQSVRNAIHLAEEQQFQSIAFPAIGSGSGGYNTEKSIEIMTDEYQKICPKIKVVLVKYKEANK